MNEFTLAFFTLAVVEAVGLIALSLCLAWCLRVNQRLSNQLGDDTAQVRKELAFTHRHGREMAEHDLREKELTLEIKRAEADTERAKAYQAEKIYSGENGTPVSPRRGSRSHTISTPEV